MADLSRIIPTDSDIAILLAPIAQRELAKAYSRQPPAWRPLTSRTDPTHFGRKRRARRARGRRIEAKRAFLGSLAQRLEPLARGLLFHQQTMRQLDEIDRFPVMTDEQAQAYLDSHREQRRMITLEKSQAMGKSEDLVERLISPCDRIAFTCHLVPLGKSFEDMVAQQEEAHADD